MTDDLATYNFEEPLSKPELYVISLAMPPPVIPMPHPQYLRPSIHLHSLELQRAFQQVCASGDLAAVVNLLNAETRSAEYLTQGLLAAIYEKRIQIAEYLLNNGAAIDRVVPIAAASVKSIALFELLIEHGWDINSPVLGGETILPSVLGDEILVRWFLEHGARPDLGPQLVNPKADSASMNGSGICLDVAARKSSILVFDMLLNHGAPRENSVALHMAAGAGVSDERIPMMTHLVALGFDVNGSDVVRGHYAIGTPLHYAISAGSVEKIKFLLGKGADPHNPAGLAGSPYKMAESSASEDIIALFKTLS